MHTLAANVFQVGMLGVGVSLFLLWINHLKAVRDESLSVQPAQRSAEGEPPDESRETAR